MSTMKVLLLYRDSCDREITSSVVSGGGEQFCKHLYNTFDCVVKHIDSFSHFTCHKWKETPPEMYKKNTYDLSQQTTKLKFHLLISILKFLNLVE